MNVNEHTGVMSTTEIDITEMKSVCIVLRICTAHWSTRGVGLGPNMIRMLNFRMLLSMRTLCVLKFLFPNE